MVTRLVLALLLASSVAWAQPEGMKTYYLVLLRKGPSRNQEAAVAQKLQEGHMANIARLHQEGVLDLAGPCLDDGDLRGIFIVHGSSVEEVDRLLQSDPAVAAGRLRLEIHPWLGMPGSVLR